MKMRHTTKKNLKIAVSAIVYTLIICSVVIIYKESLFGTLFGKMKSAMISNAPSYDYEALKEEDKVESKNPEILSQYGLVTCERIGLKAPLYLGDNEKIFEDGAGTSTRYALPGKNGTALIGGHDTTFFAPLSEIKEGDEIVVDTIYGSYTYKVTATKVEKVSKYKADKQDKESKIILYTCYPFGDIASEREERFYVYASQQ